MAAGSGADGRAPADDRRRRGYQAPEGEPRDLGYPGRSDDRRYRGNRSGYAVWCR